MLLFGDSKDLPFGSNNHDHEHDTRPGATTQFTTFVDSRKRMDNTVPIPNPLFKPFSHFHITIHNPLSI